MCAVAREWENECLLKQFSLIRGIQKAMYLRLELNLERKSKFCPPDEPFALLVNFPSFWVTTFGRDSRPLHTCQVLTLECE